MYISIRPGINIGNKQGVSHQYPDQKVYPYHQMNEYLLPLGWNNSRVNCSDRKLKSMLLNRCICLYMLDGFKHHLRCRTPLRYATPVKYLLNILSSWLQYFNLPFEWERAHLNALSGNLFPLINTYTDKCNDYCRVFILNVLHTVHYNIITTRFDEKQWKASCQMVTSRSW